MDRYFVGTTKADWRFILVDSNKFPAADISTLFYI